MLPRQTAKILIGAFSIIVEIQTGPCGSRLS